MGRQEGYEHVPVTFPEGRVTRFILEKLRSLVPESTDKCGIFADYKEK